MAVKTPMADTHQADSREGTWDRNSCRAPKMSTICQMVSKHWVEPRQAQAISATAFMEVAAEMV